MLRGIYETLFRVSHQIPVLRGMEEGAFFRVRLNLGTLAPKCPMPGYLPRVLPQGQH